jgi:hypothetical protein
LVGDVERKVPLRESFLYPAAACGALLGLMAVDVRKSPEKSVATATAVFAAVHN